MSETTAMTHPQIIAEQYQEKPALKPESCTDAFERFLRLTVADGDASPRTIKAYREGFAAFLSWCAGIGRVPELELDPKTATYEHLEAYRRHLITAGYKRPTIHARLVSVRALYKALQRWGIRPDDPAAGLRSPKEKTSDVDKVLDKTLTPDQAVRLLDLLPKTKSVQDLRDRAIVILAVFHGLRAGELVALDADDFKWSCEHERRLKLNGKGGKQRTIILEEKPYEALAEWKSCAHAIPDVDRSVQIHLLHQEIPPLPLFYRFDRPGHRRLSVRAIERTVDKYLSMAGYKRRGHSAHVLRHTFGLLAALGGADQRAIADSMGHASTSTTDVYTRAAARFVNNPGSAVAAALLKTTQQKEPQA